MNWPTPQDYNEAIQNPSFCFSDEDLKSGVVALNQLGLPAPSTGACASVYKVSSNGTDWAVRCFLNHRGDQEERYLGISEFIWKDDVDSTVPFLYLKEGLKVKGRWYPILKMEWVHGETLDTYLRKHHRDLAKMNSLLSDFQKLAFGLEIAGIAHGDLQHGNVLVTENGLRLVDYDGLYVPALYGMKSLELGHPNYQHPARTEHHFDTMVDNFSCWLIHISLQVLTIDPELFERFGGGEEWILFRRADLCDPEQSPLFTHLLEHPSDDIKGGALLLKRMLWESPEKIPELSATVEELDSLPTKPLHVVPTPVMKRDVDLGAQQAVRYKKGGFIDGTPQASSQKNRLLSKIEKDINHGTNTFFRENYFGAWMSFKLNRADREFREGRYELALSFYLEVYKQIDKTRTTGVFGIYHGVGKVLVKSAYCYGFLGQHNLAHNCFLAAYNDATTNQAFRTDIERLTFMLAMSHCLNGQPDSGIALMARTSGIERHIDKLIELELTQGYLQIPETIAFLSLLVDAKARTTKLTSPDDLIEIGYLYTAARNLYQKLGHSSTVEIERLVFGLLVDATEYLVWKGASISSILQGLKEICIEICTKASGSLFNKSGRDVLQVPSHKWTIDDYFLIGGLSKTKAATYTSILDFLTFEKSVSDRTLTNMQLLDEMEKLTPWATALFILKRLPGHKTISVAELLLTAVPSRHPKSYPLLLMTAAKQSSKLDYEDLVLHVLRVHGIEPGTD